MRLLTSGQNDCCGPYVRKMDILNIACIDSDVQWTFWLILSIMIFTDNIVGSDAILSHPLRQPLFKFDFVLLRVLFCFFVAK